jgi:glucose/arabinose dehydrogenase
MRSSTAAARTLTACASALAVLLLTASATTASPPARGAAVPAWPSVALTPVATGLAQPVFATGAGDGSGRVFVVEKTGRIRVVRNGVLLPAPFLDLSAVVSQGGEQGLLGLAFPPGYAGSGRFYVDYTDKQGNTVIARYHAVPSSDIADGSLARTILHIPHPVNANHNGGCLQFGKDGYLYQGMGDGGGGGDKPNNAQSLRVLLGKVLRIDPEGAVKSGSARAYLVPPTNPFARTAGARPEIWLRGLRNPWRFSFDRVSGDLWIGDVGQNAYEEIDAVSAGRGGLNLGWRYWEATHPYPPGAVRSRTGFAFPLSELKHDFGQCVTGGYRYRGAKTPAWNGIYFFGDFITGRLFALRHNGLKWERGVLASTGLGISSFGQDDTGELYLCDMNGGTLYRLDPK